MCCLRLCFSVLAQGAVNGFHSLPATRRTEWHKRPKSPFRAPFPQDRETRPSPIPLSHRRGVSRPARERPPARSALHCPTQCAAPANAARCIGQRTAVHFPVRHRTPHHARPSCIHPAAPEIRQKPATVQSACLHFHHSTEGQPTKNRATGVVICHKSCKFAVQRAKEVPYVHFHEPIFATNDNRRTIEIQQGVCGKEEL